MLNDALQDHVITHSFSDESGTVFFNQVTGETLGVSLSKEQLTKLLFATEIDTTVQPEEIVSLSRMIKLPLFYTEPSDEF